MIDLSFSFRESSKAEKAFFMKNSRRVKESDELSFLTGESWFDGRGIAAVRFEGDKCTIIDATLQESKVDEKESVARFLYYLVDHLLEKVHRVEWLGDEKHAADYVEVIADYDGKVVGTGRVRLEYSAGVAEVDGVKTYFVEKRKKVYVKKLSKPKEKPLTLTKAETGLSLDIADVKSWICAEFGKMEYIVLEKDSEKYWLFPYESTDEAEKVFNVDGIFSEEELKTVRDWAREQVKKENSTLSRYFAKRRAEDEAENAEAAARREADRARFKANLERLKRRNDD